MICFVFLYRETFEEYAKSVEKLAFRLLELIALSLNLPEKRLNVYFEEQTTFIRLNHYPPCPYPDLALGVGRHKDAGALTVLYQDSTGGLDVKRKSDGEWVRVKPIPNAFIINVGDIVQVKHFFIGKIRVKLFKFHNCPSEFRTYDFPHIYISCFF
jgi:isopenicillin N synthase-like dioxygenase